jgi:hypothetical protein
MTTGTSTVEIEVYGIWDEAPAVSSCGCGGGKCDTPTQTMGEMYDGLRKFIESSDLKDKCTLRFIDVIKDSDSTVSQVRKLVESGYSLPLTALNGKWSFFGGISDEIFSRKIRELLDGTQTSETTR